MSTHKSNLWCVMKECNYNVTEKRHFFMFPKECESLYKHRVEFGVNKVASWAHIVEFYNRDNKQWIKTAPKLSKNHIEPTSFQKMKVKYAVQIFSNRLAAGMCTQMSYGFLSTEAVGTIEFIDNFDKLFDILNSSSINSPKEYGKVFTGNEKLIQFLEQMIYFMKTIKVINKNNVRVKVNCFIRAFKKLFSMKVLQQTDTQNCAADNDNMLHLVGSSGDKTPYSSRKSKTVSTPSALVSAPDLPYFPLKSSPDRAPTTASDGLPPRLVSTALPTATPKLLPCGTTNERLPRRRGLRTPSLSFQLPYSPTFFLGLDAAEEASARQTRRVARAPEKTRRLFSEGLFNPSLHWEENSGDTYRPTAVAPTSPPDIADSPNPAHEPKTEERTTIATPPARPRPPPSPPHVASERKATRPILITSKPRIITNTPCTIKIKVL
ncbi:hypothetical protein ALC57_15766 [Trachymyrmex cornetzi]|uniref:Transposable element P transposase-like GTP-binding insertion domain-containing protein n=1 Tax=Trachymyrmex cornetzi TaxID=471704 RepID=A0A151IW73_9HYME|nr:hypothetical protein ALC57_15766 [Trachymyrmex cornetzi]